MSDCKTELVREETIMVGELRRIAGRCGTGIAVKSLLLFLVLIAGCSEPPPPPPPVVEVSVPTEEPKVIELAELDNVVLMPAGQGELEVRVMRNGNKGSVSVSVKGLPNGVSPSPESLVIKEGSSAGKIVLQASESLGDAEVKASVTVQAKLKEMTATRDLDVVVNKVFRPEFGTSKTILLQPGASKAISVQLKKNSFAGPVPVAVSGGGTALSAQVESPSSGNDT
ncbi:MAG: hypothetical protein KAT50_08035, partial [Pirellulales bacterium]|nr:hypothetical protein [Pirellulales bacterium]